MPILDPKNTIIILVAVLHATIGLLVLMRGERNKSNLFFVLLEASLIVWSVSMVYFRSSSGDELVFWGRLLYASALFIPFNFLYFVHFFPKNILNRFSLPWRILSIIPLFFLLWAIFSGHLLVSFSAASSTEPIIQFNHTINIFYVLYFGAYLGWAYLALAHSTHSYTLENSSLKTQANYVLFGTAVSTLIATPPNLIFPMFGIFKFNWVGQVVIVIMALAISYAIFKHNLLDIKVIAAELFAGLVGFIFIVEMFLAEGAVEVIVRLVLLLVVGIFIYFLIKSVLQEVRSREEIERLAQDLEQANKDLKRLDEAKSEFVSIASHQLRTPLSIIKGYISMAREGSFGRVNAEMKKTLNRIYLSNERLIKLVNDLLDLSRMESGKMQYLFEYFNFTEFINSIVEEFNLPATDKGVKVSWKVPPKPLNVWGDPQKLRQVAFNVVDNALKYTNEGGHIEIFVEKEDDKAKLVVKDSGIGMSNESLKGLFKKFVRGERVPKLHTEGAGLGLYVAKQIMNDHRGGLWAQSRGEGMGSIFYMTVPLKNTEETAKQLKTFIEKI